MVVLIAVGASVTGVTNQYVQDDIPLIRNDTRVHQLSDPIPFFAQTYWPPPHAEALYRPLSTAMFAIQWSVGAGSPVVFRVFSYTLYALSALAVLALARLLLPPGVALATALLFAAHPVHVEAVALGVNQSELWVGILAVLVTTWYILARRVGIPTRGTWLGLSTLYLTACLFKENALVIPGILIAADLLLVRAGDLSTRVKGLWRGFAAMIGVGIIFLVARTWVIGDAVGTFTAEAIAGQDIGGRTLTMLQVVPEWLRLLAWPAKLSGEYSPAVINQATGWEWAQATGVGILAGLALIAWLLRRRAPMTTFGILWAAAAIFPVSNIVVPTGIALAERTLFLPSIGFLLALGGLVQLFLSAHPPPSRVRVTLAALTSGLVLAGVVRSAIRHTDWRSQEFYWAKTVEFDAPLSYRAQMAFGQMLFNAGLEARSISHYYTAMALYPKGWWVQNDLADKFRLRGECHPALELYAQSLAISPRQSEARASRIACLVHLGRYAEASREAGDAIARAIDIEDFRAYRAIADSAAQVDAPPGTVTLNIHEAEEQQ